MPLAGLPVTDESKLNEKIKAKEIRLKVLKKNADVFLRANLQEDYLQALDDIKKIDDERSALQRELNTLKAKPPKYDKKQGQEDAAKIEEKFQFYKDALAKVSDPESSQAKEIKKQMDALVPDYQKALSNSSGTAISKTVAKSKLFTGSVPTFGDSQTADAGKTPAVSAPPAMAGQQPSKSTETPAIKYAPAPTGKTPAPSNTPSAPTSGALPSSFTPYPITDTTNTKREEALATAQKDFSLPETLFKNVPSLNALLEDYTSGRIVGADALRQKIRNDIWYRQNSDEIKKRFIQKYNYDDLVSKGQATGSSDYEMQIAKIEANLKKRAAAMGSAAASDPTALRKAAENLYITNRSEDDSYITDFLAAAIRPIAGMIGGKLTQGYSGDALKNYQTLQDVARANGFSVADIVPGGANESQVLGMIASGTLDINRIAQDARKMAAQGQPEYVRQLLGQGYNLDQVYKPYRQTMANILEIGDPQQIDLNDPTLRMAITDKGDMNLYDFKKALRADKRWQYTDNARQEVSAATMQVLRDFGFQG